MPDSSTVTLACRNTIFIAYFVYTKYRYFHTCVSSSTLCQRIANLIESIRIKTLKTLDLSGFEVIRIPEAINGLNYNINEIIPGGKGFTANDDGSRDLKKGNPDQSVCIANLRDRVLSALPQSCTSCEIIGATDVRLMVGGC